MKRHAKAVPTAIVATVAVLFSLFLLLAPSAQASKGVVAEFGSDGSGPIASVTHARTPCLPGDPADCLSVPSAIAINHTTGDVYVADFGNSRVIRFSEDGAFERTWGWDVDVDDPGTEFEICVAPASCKAAIDGDGVGQLAVPRSIAINQSNGDVYVATGGFGPSHGIFPDSIKRFDLDGNYIDRQAAPNDDLAVKPISNSLLIGGSSISWRDAAGNPLGDFEFGVPGYETEGIGADSAGEIYVSPRAGAGAALKLSSSGDPLGEFAPDVLNGQAPGELAVDPLGNRIYVTRLDRPGTLLNPGNALHEIAELDPEGNLVDLHATGMPQANGIAVNPGNGRIYAVVGIVTPENVVEPAKTVIPSRILVIDTVANPPVPQITSISSITSSGATLNGTVDPEGTAFATGFHWEYRKQGTQSWTVTPVPDVEIGNGTDPVALDPLALTGLEPSTTYEVRLVAIRKGGAGSAIDTDSFKTSGQAPDVTERRAYPVADTTAQLRALVDPNNAETTYFFDYGPTEDYGQSTPVRSMPAVNDDVPVYATIGGLQPETTYHFRLVADNGVGDPVEGPDLELTTRSTAEMAWPTRGIELVTPPDTGAQNPSALLSPYSDRAIWSTLSGAPGSPTGASGSFLAERTLATPTGWQSRSLLPPIDQMIGNGESVYRGIGGADDFSRVAFVVEHGSQSSFVRTEQTGEQTFLPTVSQQAVFSPGSVEVSADVDHVFLRMSQPEVPEHTDPDSTQVYDIGYGDFRLISRMPDNSVPPCGVVSEFSGERGAGFGGTAYEWFSTDSSPGAPLRVYFESAGEDCVTPGDLNDPQVLYMRDDKGTSTPSDDETALVSGPPVSGTDEGSIFMRTNKAGDEVVFVSRTRLDLGDTNSTADLYKWSIGEGSRCLTCGVAEADVIHGRGYLGERQVVVSPNLDRVYFRSRNQLVPGEGIPGSAGNVYVVRDMGGGPEIEYVSQGGTDPESTEISDDGEVIVFRSENSKVTPERTGGFAQYYRYDDSDGSIECITCPPPGVPAGKVNGTGGAGLGAGTIVDLARASLLTESGDTFVFTSAVPYLSRDVNGSMDVYEWRRDGRLRLVSDGVTRFSSGPGAPSIQGISADGRNIMFSVGARLTGHEIEPTRQVYVARVGGGFPPPDPPEAPCIEDACQGPLAPPPSLSASGSASFVGKGNQKGKAAKARKRCKGGRVRRGQRCVRKRKQADRAKRKGTTRRGRQQSARGSR